MPFRRPMRLIRRTVDRFSEVFFDSLAEFGMWLYAYAADHGGEIDAFVRFTKEGQLDVTYSIAALEADGWIVEIDSKDKEDLPYVP